MAHTGTPAGHLRPARGAGEQHGGDHNPSHWVFLAQRAILAWIQEDDMGMTEQERYIMERMCG